MPIASAAYFSHCLCSCCLSVPLPIASATCHSCCLSPQLPIAPAVYCSHCSSLLLPIALAAYHLLLLVPIVPGAYRSCYLLLLLHISPATRRSGCLLLPLPIAPSAYLSLCHFPKSPESSLYNEMSLCPLCHLKAYYSEMYVCLLEAVCTLRCPYIPKQSWGHRGKQTSHCTVGTVLGT